MSDNMFANWSKARGIRIRELDTAGAQLPELTVTLDEQKMADMRTRFREFPALLDSAIREASASVSVKLRRVAVQDLIRLSTLMPKYIAKAVKCKKGLGARGAAEVRVASLRLPLVRYSVAPSRPPQLKGVPVSRRPRTRYRLAAGGKEYGDMSYSSPDSSRLFVQTMDSGHVGVFYRKAGGDIVQERGPSAQFHLFAGGELQRLLNAGGEMLETELESCIKKMGAK